MILEYVVFYFYWYVVGDGVDVGGEKYCVVGGCVDVVDFVYLDFVVVCFEECF